MAKKNRYTQIIEFIFKKYYSKDSSEVAFDRSDIEYAANELDIDLPKNLGDVIYTFRYRSEFPRSISSKASEDKEWIIRPTGRSQYAFVLVAKANIVPSKNLVETKILDSTPGVIDKYSLNDEQALLAKIRYNRLIDIFTGLTCYSLQNHLRTSIKGIGQVEIDEIYVGVDTQGVQYILPVQAKGTKDKIGVVQIEQDIAVCNERFPNLVCMPVATQFTVKETIAIFQLEQADNTIAIAAEKQYRLVDAKDLSADELLSYRRRVP